MASNNVIGHIYAIKSDQTEKIYIGSTSKSLEERFRMHKSHYKSHAAGKHNYLSSFDILDFPDARIELLMHAYEGEDIKQLEQDIIDSKANVVNRNRSKSAVKCISTESIHHCDVCDCDVKLGMSIHGKFYSSNIYQHENTKKHKRNLAAFTSAKAFEDSKAVSTSAETEQAQLVDAVC